MKFPVSQTHNAQVYAEKCEVSRDADNTAETSDIYWKLFLSVSSCYLHSLAESPLDHPMYQVPCCDCVFHAVVAHVALHLNIPIKVLL